jgi:hypothetical protein
MLWKRMFAGVLGMLVLPHAIGHGAWTFLVPMEDATLSRTVPVAAYGNGEGATTTLIFKVMRDSEPLSVGDGNWNGSGLWSASAGAPSGGFSAGDAVLKLWKTGDEGSPAAVLVTRDVTF